MVQIPLEVYEYAGSLRIMAHFFLKIEEPIKIFLPIRAIVDTGSPKNLIGSADLGRMRISKIQLQKLQGRNNPVNIGGGKITTRKIENAKITFGNDFTAEIPVDFPIEGGEVFQPSLLGVDFMLKTGAKLFFDPTNKKAYFEIEN